MDILKGIAIKDPNIKIIINARKFEAIWSIYYGIIQPDADAVVLIFADLQDTQNLIVDFIKKWEEGYHIVKGIKTSSEENFGSSLLGMVRLGGINRPNPYLARDLIG